VAAEPRPGPDNSARGAQQRRRAQGSSQFGALHRRHAEGFRATVPARFDGKMPGRLARVRKRDLVAKESDYWPRVRRGAWWLEHGHQELDGGPANAFFLDEYGGAGLAGGVCTYYPPMPATSATAVPRPHWVASSLSLSFLIRIQIASSRQPGRLKRRSCLRTHRQQCH